MRNRRDFLKTVAGATTGALLAGKAFAGSPFQGAMGGATAAGTRREVSIGGRRVKVVDIHAHCVIPEVAELVKGTPFEAVAGGRARGPNVMGPERICADR